jgi:polysaccharide chain length determinant protein (PEP-CTERM system associated)
MNAHERPDPLSQAKEFWGTIVLHRWGVLLASVLLAAICVVIITVVPDHYEASTTVFFDPESLPVRYISTTVTADPTQRLNTLTEEVLNTSRLQQINEQLHLYSNGIPSAQSIAQMRKAITIDMKQSPENEVHAFAIKFTYTDPQMVATAANQLAQSFIDWDLANREHQAKSTTEFMASQLEEARQTFNTEEAKIDEFKRRHSGELPEQLEFNMQKLSPLHAALQANTEALERLEQQKTMLIAVPEPSHATVGAPTDRDRLETEQRALEAELADLRAEYTEEYPDVVTAKLRLQTVTKQLDGMEPTQSTRVSSSAARLEVINHETDRLQGERKDLAGRISEYEARVDATAQRGQQLEALSRNYNTARDQYEGLLDKKFHAEMAMNLENTQKSSRFTMVPAQVPDTPVKPNRPVLLALTLPLCFFLPAGVVIGAAEVRGTVNSERRLRSLLPDGTRVVGNIPMIETPSNARGRRRMAMLSVLGCLLCIAAVTAFLWGGAGARKQRKDAHQVNPNNPSARLLQQ